MKKVLCYLKKTKLEVILGPLFKMIEVIFELLVPVIVSQIIDEGIKKYNGDLTYIILMCGLLLLFALLGLISSITAQYFSAKAAVKLTTNLNNDLFKKIQSLEYSELDKIGYSTLVTRMTSDVNQIQIGVNMTLRLLLRSPVVVIGSIFVSFFISKEIGWIFLFTAPTLFIVIFIIIMICIPKFKTNQSALDSIVELTRENLTGVKVIRAFNKQNDEIIKYEKLNEKYTKLQIIVGRISNLTNPITFALINIFIIILINAGAIQVNIGNISQGNVVALYNLISQILVETIKFANLIITISKAIASCNRVEEILNINSKMETSSSNENSPYFIEFKNVSMKYKSSQKYSLNNISFKVNKGDTIGIIGGTGSGKTTLINLLNHFYDIDEGTIYFNGKELTSIDSDELHKKIALVPQKAKLFKGTIRSNLLWGNQNATEEDLISAIKVAQAEDIILKKSNGLDEIVEQNGNNFSGGQKQRLCIARALVKKAEVLILDDSSSALDYLTDFNLRKSIRDLDDSLTTFIVSQRTASVQNCDQILVLDKGFLVGYGTHNQLLNECNIYKEIYLSQFKGEEK